MRLHGLLLSLRPRFCLPGQNRGPGIGEGSRKAIRLSFPSRFPHCKSVWDNHHRSGCSTPTGALSITKKRQTELSIPCGSPSFCPNALRQGSPQHRGLPHRELPPDALRSLQRTSMAGPGAPLGAAAPTPSQLNCNGLPWSRRRLIWAIEKSVRRSSVNTQDSRHPSPNKRPSPRNRLQAGVLDAFLARPAGRVQPSAVRLRLSA